MGQTARFTRLPHTSLSLGERWWGKELGQALMEVLKMLDQERISKMSKDEIVASVDVTALDWKMPNAFLDFVTSHAIYEKEDEFQRTLAPHDPRHKKMFAFHEGGTWLEIYWGGGAYPYEMDRFKSPDDIIWFIHHISAKTWKHATLRRVGYLIAAIAQRKNWPMYGRVPHPNEAPTPNHDKIEQREKMTAKIRYSVIKRDGYRCRACGYAVQDGAHLHVDHIVAVANGGRTEMHNLQTLCTVCNLGKGAS